MNPPNHRSITRPHKPPTHRATHAGSSKTLLTGFVLAIALSGCSTVTIQPNQGLRIDSPPTYKERHHYFVFGLVGEKHVNLARICRGREPVKMQRQSTLVDMTLQTVTLSLYKPVTAKVWC